ncbi:MAG: TraB/VirB10 family protein [Neisseriaceae bacterium]|nr:TraB/VirB10 family protein [Neisseriaceae bacterium]
MGLFDKLKNMFGNMNSGQKKKSVVIVLCILLVAIVVWAGVTDNKNGAMRPKKKTQQTQVLNAANRNLTLEDLAQRMYALDRRFEQQALNNQQMIQQMFAQYQPQQSATLSEDDVIRIIANEKISGSLSDLGNNTPFTDPANPQAPLAGIDGVGGEEEDENRQVFKTLITNPDSLAAAEAKAKAAGKNYLPAGTTISFVSVGGMNAPTNAISSGIAGAGELMPTLLRVRGQAILPNKNYYDLQDCVVLAVGYGQMADERAILRTDKMSCISPNGQTTEVAIQGTVFGEDGKPGMRGRLVSMNGKVIAQMVRIGALQTLGNMAVAFAGNYDFKNHSDINNGVTVNTGNQNSLQNEMAKAGAAGINDTFQRIAGIYEQYAQQTFPVIEVNPGRKGEIVLMQGVEIDFNGANK